MSELASAVRADQLSIVDFVDRSKPDPLLPAEQSNSDPSFCRPKRASGGALVWCALCALGGALAASLWCDDWLAGVFLLLLLIGFVLILQTLLHTSRISKAAGVVFVSLAFVLTGLRQGELVQHDLDYLLGEHVTISGTVSAPPAAGGILLLSEGSIVERDSQPIKLASTVQVTLSATALDNPGAIIAGQIIAVRGILSRPLSHSFSFQGKPSTYFASRGIYFLLDHAYIEHHRFSGRGGVMLAKPSMAVPLGAWRERLLHFFCGCLSSQGAQLIASMVMGDRAITLSPALKLDFNRVGLSHLLAASGMNLTIILGFVLALSGQLQKIKSAHFFSGAFAFKQVELAVCVFSVLGFSLLAGSSPSVFRATVMCLLALFARCIFRQITATRALALSLLLSLWLNPLSVFDIGLQLSYSATFGVLCLYPLVDACLRRCLPLPGKVGRGLIAIIAIVLAAQCAVLPLQLYYFGQFSTVFLLANTLAEPLVAPVTVLGFIATLLVSPFVLLSLAQGAGGAPLLASAIAFSRILLLPAYWVCLLAAPFIQLLLFLVQQLSAFPLSTLVVARPALPVVLLWYGLFLLLVYQSGTGDSQSKPKLEIRLGALVLASSALLVLCCQIFGPSLEVVWGRDSFCLRRTGQFIVLHQSGTRGSAADEVDATMRAFLRSRSEPLHSISDNCQYSDDQVDCVSVLSEGAERIQLRLKRDNLLIVASRQRGAQYTLSSQPLSAAPTFIATPSGSRGGGLNVIGSLAIARCLPYLDWALPLYPTLACRIEQVSSRYMLTFALQ